jgi:hypothetical protein
VGTEQIAGDDRTFAKAHEKSAGVSGAFRVGRAICG